MLDPYWHAAWTAVSPLLVSADRLLMPQGEWPPAGCPVRFYHNSIDVQDATVLFLHKGKMAGLRKPELRLVMASWQCVFANEVFVCFAARFDRPAVAQPLAESHVTIVRQYLRSRALKRIRNTVYFVHLPKAGGTSLWNLFSERVRSKIYYDTFQSFNYNPPGRGEYDLVGGHVPLPIMGQSITRKDRVVGVIRDPTLRFRSAFLHSRRDSEDASTFTDSMLAMRTQPLRTFLETPYGEGELRQQLLMLGFDFACDYSTDLDESILSHATAWLKDPRTIFCTVDQLDAFVGTICSLLHVKAPGGSVPVSNSSDTAGASTHLNEFEAERPTITTRNVAEQRLYALAWDRFEAIRQNVR